MTKSLLIAAVLLASPALAAPVALSSVDHPPVAIADASVLDSTGHVLGMVQRVEVTPDGRPTQVAVVTAQDQLVVLNAGKLRYDAASNQIMADTSTAELIAPRR